MAQLTITRGLGIQNWLTLLLVLILLPLIVLQGYQYYDYYRARQEAALQENLEIARAVAKSFESFVQDVLRQELAIGLAITSSNKMTPDDITRLFETSRDYPAVRDFNWLNPEGIVIYSNNPSIVGADASDRSYFREVVNGREWAVSELIIGRVSGKPTFGISRGIRDDKGNLLGVILASILPDKLDQQLAIERSKGGAISLVDRQGMLVYRYPAIDVTWEERNWLRIYPDYEEVFKGREISKTMFATYEGKDRLVSIVPISSIGWAAGAGKRKEDVTGPITQSLVRDAVLFLSVSLIAFLIAAALSRKITNPIGALRTYASSLGDGKAPQQVNVENVSELRDLAESFDTMAEKIQSRETALQESEKQLRLERDFSKTLLETAGATIIVLNREGRITHFNQACERLTGYSSEEVMGRIFWEFLIPPEDLQGVRQTWNALCEGDFPNQHENHWVAKDGSRHLIAWNNSAIAGQSGNIEYIIGTGLDITERKRSEQALQQAHARAKWLARLPEENPSPVLRVSVDGLSQYCNPAAMELDGWKCEVDQPIPDPVLLLVRKALAEDREVVQDIYLGDKSYSVAVTPFPAEEYANVYGLDITERKKAEEALQKAKNELEQRVTERTYELYLESLYARNLIEASLDPLVTISIEGKITDVNRSTEDVTGLLREQLIGSDFSDYFTDQERARAGYKEVIQQGLVRDYPLELKHRDGHVTPVLYNATLYQDELGNVMGVFAAARDITERKKAEAALRKLASELVMTEERERKRIAGVLHDEIAQTLAAAKMRMDVIRGIPSDHEKSLIDAKALLAQSIRETRALMNAIGNPLLFDMGLKAASESLADQLMDNYSVRIICDIQDEYKHTDPDVKSIVFQVIRELLNNVVKHSKAQNAHVILDMEDGRFRVRVSDDGAGFDPQTLGVPTDAGGFGLYSIRERLIAMKGSLRIESAPGRGTVVTAILPASLDSTNNVEGKPA